MVDCIPNMKYEGVQITIGSSMAIFTADAHVFFVHRVLHFSGYLGTNEIGAGVTFLGGNFGMERRAIGG